MNTLIFVNIFCIMIIAVLLVGINLQKEHNDTLSDKFIMISISLIVFFGFNIFTELLEGKPELKTLSFIANLFLFFCADYTVLSFSQYLKTMLGDQCKDPAMFSVVLITSIIRMALVVVLAFTGNLFSIENGHYVQHYLCIVPYIFTFIIMLELIFIVLQNRQFFSTTETVVILTYLLLPFVPVVIELFTGMYFLTTVSMTISLLMVYVMIQAGAIERNKAMAKIMEELSQKDLLTGLLNRRSYYKYISRFLPEQNLGIVFCDINGLKYTNDHFGHAEGDKLIQRFAEILRKNFDESGIFRMSGDEFVVIVPNIQMTTFKKIYDAFVSDLAENDKIAATGNAYGTGICFDNLMTEAENKMYEDKRSYHNNR